uniref:Uncharacterized protein n=1 Tax=viral metagenome TaxID=1070528 RepID=A0A6C0AD73_9ZZZZ
MYIVYKNIYFYKNFINYLKKFYKKLEDIYYFKILLILFGTFYKLL